MRDFMMAAVPLVVVGIALAVFFTGRAGKKKKQEKESGYEAEGMSLGMCFGAAVGAIFPEFVVIVQRSDAGIAGFAVQSAAGNQIFMVFFSLCLLNSCRRSF